MGYFDSVMQAPALDYEEATERRGRLDSFVNDLPVPFQNVPEEQQAALRASGYVQQGDTSNFVTPERQLLAMQNERITALQGQLEQEAQQKLNNPLFRIGDTLADAGRLFLSPIFWLSGQDGTEYDPSQRIKTGYRQRFEQLESLRFQNAEKFLTARESRMSSYTTLLSNMRNMNAPLSSAMKELQDFAELTGQSDVFNSGDVNQINNLKNQMSVQKGDAYMYNNRVVPKNLYDTVDTYSEKFNTAVSGYRSAYEGYNRLVEALSFEGGIADIATVFSFMKALDPTSVVREGEFNVTATAGGLYDRLGTMLDKYKTGDLLPETVKREMATVARQLMESYTSSYDQLRNQYTGKASAIGFGSDEDINTFFGAPMPLPQPPNRGIFKSQTPTPLHVPVEVAPSVEDLVDKYLPNVGG